MLLLKISYRVGIKGNLVDRMVCGRYGEAIGNFGNRPV
jgi:hypothetical protein